MLGRDAMQYFSEWKQESPSNSINNNLLLIGMSANASIEDQNDAFDRGMHFFGTKPVDIDFLDLILKSFKKHNQNLNDCVEEIRRAIVLNIEYYKNKGCHIRRDGLSTKPYDDLLTDPLTAKDNNNNSISSQNIIHKDPKSSVYRAFMSWITRLFL